MKKYVLIITTLFSLFAINECKAQEVKSPIKDSLSVSAANNNPKTTIVADSIDDSATDSIVVFKPIPRKATWYAVFAPGLGQIYNQKYWKLPIIYGAFVGLAYGITWNGRYYNQYKQAYADILSGDKTRTSYMKMLPVGVNMNQVDMVWFTTVLQQKEESYKNARDLSIIGIVLVYGLSIVDAYVDAQLFDFNISPDLTLNFQPQVFNPTNTANVGLGLQCRFRF